ncbi:MAG: VOC family protein [Proteobacteria bacterium]|nr:VOC family protein [Pseudomonadota bacterium]
MIAHTSLAVHDYPRAKDFYTRTLSPLGYRNNMEYGESAGFNDGENTDFWIASSTSTVPTHIAFRARNPQQVVAFHEAALAAGGRDNGPPGYRDYSPGYYAAFALDPEGNNIEAVWYDPAREKQSASGDTPVRLQEKADVT